MIDAGYLRTLGSERLAALLRARSDVLAVPELTCLEEVARRLAESHSVVAALRRLALPVLEVAEPLSALGADPSRAALDRLLGVPGAATAADVDAGLGVLRAHALLAPHPSLRLTHAATQVWGRPLGLGPSATVLLSQVAVDDLKALARNLGLRSQTRKADLVAALIAALGDADRVRALVADAPPAARALLLEVASAGGPLPSYDHFSPRYSRAPVETPTRWAQTRGLLVQTARWGSDLEMPAEVTLALRGPGWTAPFEPLAPELPRVAVAAATVESAGAAAAAGALRLVTGLLDESSRTPLAGLKNGGVGVREVRRLAKTVATSTAEVRLGLSVAVAAGLLAVGPGGFAPTPGYDEWVRGEPAERLADLVEAWSALQYVPLVAPEDAWVPADPEEGTPEFRRLVLDAAARPPGDDGGPAGTGYAVPDHDALAHAARWRGPCVLFRRDQLEVAVASWREAALLGLTGAHAVTAAGMALIAGDRRALVAALAGIGEVHRTARFQADLTAVVTGTATPDLAELLDAAADRESVGVACTWRFSPASVRRALDAGHDPGSLLADLNAVAAGGLPQPLDYLVRDVARRHGAVRAREVACCLRSDDVALLAEIAADRRLRGLGLRPLAATVLSSAKPLAETLAGLRGAGYAPTAESADGLPVLERTVRHRAGGGTPARGRRAAGGAVGPRPDVDALAAALLAGPRLRNVGGRGPAR